jgi:hypothetical protein
MKLFRNITAALAVSVIVFAGCKNPARDIQIVVNTDIFKSPMLLQFVNARPELDGPQNFDVTITGPGASLVRTTTGGKNYKVAGGLLNILLDRSANPSPASPVKFTVVANAAGYAPTYQDVTVTSATEPLILRVAMNQYANPAANTGAIVSTRATTNGTTTSDLVITTVTNAGMALKSAVTVPSGTSLLDAAGQPVGGNQVEARIVHYSAAGASVMPGGSFAANVIGANNQPIASGVNLNIAGAVSIDMFFGGKEVKAFSKPVNVDIEVNNAMINPTTNQPIKENETIPMWSLNDETGQWKNEGTAMFVKNAAGALVARMQINHLSGYSVAYDAPLCAAGSTKVTINKPASTGTGVQQFQINYGGLSVVEQMTNGETSKTITLVGTPNKGGEIKVAAMRGGYVNNTFTSSHASLCGVNPSVNFVAQQDLVNIEIDIKLQCSGKNLLTGVNAFFMVTPVGKPLSEGSAFGLSNGVGSATAINGVTYRLSASVDGVNYSTDFKVEKKNGSVGGGSAVGSLSGSSTYDAASNTLTIEGLVTKRCN